MSTTTRTTHPTDEAIARAQAAGRCAGRAGAPMRCPYPLDQRVLRARWARAYAQARGVFPRTMLDAFREWWGR